MVCGICLILPNPNLRWLKGSHLVKKKYYAYLINGYDQGESGDGGGDGGVGVVACSAIRASVDGDIGADSSVSNSYVSPAEGTGSTAGTAEESAKARCSSSSSSSEASSSSSSVLWKPYRGGEYVSIKNFKIKNYITLLPAVPYIYGDAKYIREPPNLWDRLQKRFLE
ncbi:hypothetical protein Tco_1197457 [Tanacetum coccineum]